tara:strand:- start:471 stop:764 length:294 start_codon:yes stop_codon:yes gene_type:complete
VVKKINNMKKPFKLRSGNKASFKMIQQSPTKKVKKILRKHGKRFLGPAGVALTAYDAYDAFKKTKSTGFDYIKEFGGRFLYDDPNLFGKVNQGKNKK